MKNLKNISTLILLVTAFAFGACSQDENMDDIMGNTEITSPADPDPSDEPSKDKPGN